MTHTVALIEDDEILAKTLSEALREAGFTVFNAYDGEEGVRVVERELPNLVLLDIRMPKLDGYAVAKRLKQNSATKNIPVIILTVLEGEEAIARALDVGVFEYLAKSEWTIENIVTLVRKKLERPAG
ncbi:MAG: response regulator [Parcubacteria group bacterium]|nr:response regulator [Parcubacteria group bacterium]